ncbi:MBL fold metallo-hydrolase RNA specificity domain-containing protein [Emticicia sp. C21]|uniref:MBL fold metallo-hydrolase RNA specificity domain-containing protein n=1 Tax=Emticicia sp. C21 TaxID=2302915 RepID=UPI000E356CD5|nr:MBL fold metallo-hydrolase [Emticicia sp. C21]RFS15975.1 MBL fold metallo-hydrolase [Emticicia sp. C21]
MKIQFYGAAQRVTGSKHLITTQKGTKILLDCGLFQGINTSELNLNFGFDAKEIDILVLSHGHIDHTGLVPRLVKKGFKGQIYATNATKDLCDIMLYDSAYIQEKDLERVNERRHKRGESLLELLYGEEDVRNALSLFKTIDYRTPFYLEEGVKAEFYDAGHLLGSAGIYLTFEETQGTKTLFFTGDVGRPNDKILRSPEAFPQADYIISESTYGDRLHEPEIDMKAHLLKIVHDTCVVRRGKLIIPAFAVDRTQELVYALDQLESEGRLPKIQVYVDSPLAVKATIAMKENEECFNPEILDYIKHDGDAFNFDNLHYISEVNQSKALNSYKEPCIIISASGMAEAGRIKHHIANNVENPNNTILLVGYCSPESLGAVLKGRPEHVKIFGELHKLNAKVEVMDSFSAHADYSELITYLGCQDASKVKSLFLVHGELPTQLAFKNRLLLAGFKNILIPAQGEGFDL